MVDYSVALARAAANGSFVLHGQQNARCPNPAKPSLATSYGFSIASQCANEPLPKMTKFSADQTLVQHHEMVQVHVGREGMALAISLP